MALFNRKEKSSSQKPKKQSRKGILGALGVETEAAPTAEDEKAKQREDLMKQAWIWLRARIDAGVHDYYRTGNFNKLEEYIERPSIDALKQELFQLRSDNILWEQPDRKLATEPKITIVDYDLNDKKQPIKFIVRERFRDFSVHRKVVDNQLVPDSSCPGTERVIEAVVSVEKGSAYKLRAVRQVRDATIG